MPNGAEKTEAPKGAVVAGLDPAIQAATRDRAPRPEVAGCAGAWMAGSSPAMTRRGAAIGAVLQPERRAWPAGVTMPNQAADL